MHHTHTLVYMYIACLEQLKAVPTNADVPERCDNPNSISSSLQQQL